MDFRLRKENSGDSRLALCSGGQQLLGAVITGLYGWRVSFTYLGQSYCHILLKNERIYIFGPWQQGCLFFSLAE